jgi:hypothetical protein
MLGGVREEARSKKQEGRGRKQEARRKREEGRGKKEEGRKTKISPGTFLVILLSCDPVLFNLLPLSFNWRVAPLLALLLPFQKFQTQNPSW